MGWRTTIQQLVQKIIEIFLVVMASFSFTQCVSAIFQIEFDENQFLRNVLCWSVLLLIITLMKKIRWIGYISILSVWTFYLWKNWERIEKEKNLIPIMFLGVLIVGISIYLYQSSLVLIALSVFLVGAMLLLDLYPERMDVFCWFATVLAVRSMSRKGAGKTSVLVFCTSLILLVAINHWFSTPVARIIYQHNVAIRDFQAKINNQLEDLTRFFGLKTQINGKLDNEDPGDDKRVDLIVSVVKMPQKNLYLKGFIGQEYLSYGWSEISDTQLAEEMQKLHEEHMNYAMIQSQLINAYYDKCDFENNYVRNPLELLEKEDIVIRYQAYNGKYALIPYGSRISRQESFFADGIVLSNGADEYHYQVYPLDEKMSLEDITSHSLDPVLKWYENYAQERYRGGFEGVESVNEFGKKYSGRTFFDARDYISGILLTNYAYSKQLNPLPFGADFTEYFLMVEKKGYCTHFATAATLLFRRLGYCARYVSGYVVKPDDFSLTEEGYVAEVTGNMAHSWTEVLLDGIWYPVEMTPGYRKSAWNYYEQTEGYPVNEDLEETEEELEDDDTKVEEEVLEEEETEEKEQDDISKNPVIIRKKFNSWRVIGYSLLAGILFLLLRRMWIILYYKFIVYKDHPRKTVIRIARRMLKMAECAGYKQGVLSDLEFVRKLRNEEAQKVIEIAQKAKYSPDIIDTKDVVFCMNTFLAMEKSYYRRLNSFTRILWKYLWCYR